MDHLDLTKARDVLADQIRQMLGIPLASVDDEIASQMTRRADHILAQMGLVPNVAKTLDANESTTKMHL